MYSENLEYLVDGVTLNGFFTKFDQDFWYSFFYAINYKKSNHTIFTKLATALARTPG